MPQSPKRTRENMEQRVANARDITGIAGEKVAEQFLRKLRYKLLERRFLTPVGELDLIFRDRETIVFVEVKTQKSAELLDPEQRVTKSKQAKLSRAAAWYVQEKRLQEKPLRFDVVAIIQADDKQMPEILHVVNAFVPDSWPH